MSQRNPMNERYQGDGHTGKTRRSAASAKPKKEAAGTVVVKTSRQTPKERKAEQKEARKKEQERQRELDKKYYKPDTEQYKKLRRIWWVALIGAIVCVAASWLLRGVQPEWLAMVALFGAYGLIIFAFYIDFSKIRKERKKYQEKMVALEREEERKGRKGGAQKKQDPKKDAKDKDAKGKISQMKEARAKDAASKNSRADSAQDDSNDGDSSDGAKPKKSILRFKKAKQAKTEVEAKAEE